MIAADIDRDIAALPEIMRLAEAFFRSAEAPAARYAVELALEEIFTNMVKYNESGRGAIRVGIDRREDQIVVTLVDSDAPRFDPFTEAPETDVSASLAERTPGGLGIHLVRKMMDRIEYSHTNRTATVTLYKRVH